jgi:hypothetical protein
MIEQLDHEEVVAGQPQPRVKFSEENLGCTASTILVPEQSTRVCLVEQLVAAKQNKAQKFGKSTVRYLTDDSHS